MSWIEDASRVPVPVVAQGLGLQVRAREFGPCPACNADKRGSHDRRAPCTITPKGWKCWACGVGGTSTWLVALKVAGGELTAGDPRWSQVRAWFAERGHLSDDPTKPRKAPPRPPSPAARWSGLRPVYPGTPVSVARALEALDCPALLASDRRLRAFARTIAELDLARVDGIRLALPAWRRDGTLADVVALPARAEDLRPGRILAAEPGVLALRGTWYLDLAPPDAVLVTGPAEWLGVMLRVADAPSAGGWGRGARVLVYGVRGAQDLAGLPLPERVYAGPGAPADLAAVLGRRVTRLEARHVG